MSTYKTYSDKEIKTFLNVNDFELKRSNSHEFYQNPDGIVFVWGKNSNAGASKGVAELLKKHPNLYLTKREKRDAERKGTEMNKKERARINFVPMNILSMCTKEDKTNYALQLKKAVPDITPTIYADVVFSRDKSSLEKEEYAQKMRAIFQAAGIPTSNKGKTLFEEENRIRGELISSLDFKKVADSPLIAPAPVAPAPQAPVPVFVEPKKFSIDIERIYSIRELREMAEDSRIHYFRSIKSMIEAITPAIYAEVTYPYQTGITDTGYRKAITEFFSEAGIKIPRGRLPKAVAEKATKELMDLLDIKTPKVLKEESKNSSKQARKEALISMDNFVEIKTPEQPQSAPANKSSLSISCSIEELRAASDKDQVEWLELVMDKYPNLSMSSFERAFKGRRDSKIRNLIVKITKSSTKITFNNQSGAEYECNRIADETKFIKEREESTMAKKAKTSAPAAPAPQAAPEAAPKTEAGTNINDLLMTLIETMGADMALQLLSVNLKVTKDNITADEAVKLINTYKSIGDIKVSLTITRK